MGVRSCVKFVFRRILEIFVLTVILTLIPNLPPNANFSKSIKVTPPKPLTGTLSLNNKLDSVEIWHKGDFVGPEAFADFNGEIYTSLYSGDIVKLTGEHITPVVKFGKPCKETYEEPICGRPLGIQFDKDGFLYAADAYYGIFKVNVATGHKEQLVSPRTVIDGKVPMIFNSIALAENGDIYWTDSSTEFNLEDGVYVLLADPTGRLIHYDAKTKKNRVLINEIHFANGVALSENEDFVIVADTTQSRIHRYFLKGSKKGTHDVFIDGLPGIPDNLKSDGKGGFLVPLVMARDEDHPAIFQSILPFPRLRKAVARSMAVFEYLFKKIDQVYPNEVSLKITHFVGSFQSTTGLSTARTSLLRVNKDGVITDSVHSLNKKIATISEMHVFKDTLYLGSPFNDYIARVPLAKLGWEDLRKNERIKREAPVESPKVTSTTSKPTTTTTTPKPTTTTPKPTTTTPKPITTTTPKPTTTTPKPTTTTSKQSTTPKSTTTTSKPTTTPKPTTKPEPKPSAAPSKPSATTPKPATTTQSSKTAAPKLQSKQETKENVKTAQQKEEQKQVPTTKASAKPAKANQN